MNEVLLDLLVVAALVVAAAGIIVPVLPGTLLALGALLVWAVVTGGAIAWGAFARHGRDHRRWARCSSTCFRTSR